MIVVDTSALVAILLREPEAQPFSAVVARADRALIAAPTAFEFRLVILKKKGPIDLPDADRLIMRKPFEIVAWEFDHVFIATDALARFGKGRHPAALNYGDCMAYALAKSLGAPLLFKGDDFAQTDVERAV